MLTIQIAPCFKKCIVILILADGVAYAMMDRYMNFELAEMHLVYGRAQGNARNAERMNRDQFPNLHLPGPRFSTNLHMRLRETGMFRTDRRVNAGRPANRVFVDEDLIVQHFERNSRDSTRRVSRRFENINHMNNDCMAST